MAPLAHTLHGTPERSDLTTALVLVLLHAYPMDSRMWDGVIAHLHEAHPGLPILTVDAPGFGDSPSGEETAAALELEPTPSLETYATALEDTLERLEINNIVLAGLSLGGYAALAYAEAHPERIRGLALLNTKAEADTEPARKVRLSTAARVLADGTSVIETSLPQVLGETTRATAPDLVAALRADLLAAPPQGVAWIQLAMAARPTRLAVLAALEVPGLVLRGEEDTLAPQESAEAMAEALGLAGLGDDGVLTLPRVGHLSALEAPDAVASALADLYTRAGA